MGLLDYADLARKKLAGLLGEMPLVQMAQGRAEMPTRAGLLESLKAMPVFSPDAGQSAYEAAMNIGPMGLGKIVYHGSPHKFDKFDASKIGTGEGAQAYGHGIYLADSEGVAKEYRRVLSDRTYADHHRESLNAATARKYAEKWQKMLDDPSLPRPQMAITRQPVNDDWLRKEIQSELEESARATNRLAEFDPGGTLYKLDLPDEWIPKMLDWDKPVPKETIESLAKQGIDALPANRAWARGMLETWKEYAPREGREVIETLSKYLGKENTAAFLKAGGIPGIRYLDGGSRPNSGRITMLEQTIANLQGKGASKAAISNAQRELDAEIARASYNYVVFPGLEDQVKILERNGIPLSGLLGGQ